MMKKILFWINSGTMSIFGLSKYLQDEIDGEFYAIYDIPEKPKKFFQEQKFIDFEKTWFYNDFIETRKNIDYDYLKKFEENYKIDLWKLASTERIFLYNEFYKFSTNEIYSILETECRFFENVINEIKPEYVIMVRPYFHHDMIFLQLCKAKGIKVLELELSRFPSRCTIGFSENRKRYNDFQIDKTIRNFDELTAYRKRNSGFKQDVDYTNTKKDFFRAGLEYISSNNSTIENNYKYFGRSKVKVLFNYIYDILRTRHRKNFLDKNFLKIVPNKKKYILFALSVDAESGILLDAPFHINQIEVVKNVAKSIPAEYTLLVKEHPASGVRSWRSTQVYKELISTPNVIPIHPTLNIDDLIKVSSLVISISSSSSLDALFYGKPSIIFSNTDFSMISDIKKLDEIEKLPLIIKNELKREINSCSLEKYIQFIEKNSFEYDMVLHGQMMQKFLYHGSLLADVEINDLDMKRFFEETKNEFLKLKNAYLQVILKESC